MCHPTAVPPPPARLFPTFAIWDAHVPAGQAHHGGLLKALYFAEGSWWKLETGKAAASFATCTLPRFLPWGWKLWKYQALTLQSIKENRGWGEKNQTITWGSSRSCWERL